MKILINALLLNSRFSGVQFSTENLLLSLAKIDSPLQELEVLLPADYPGQFKDRQYVRSHKTLFPAARRLKRIFYEHFRLPGLLRKEKAQLYHATGYILPWFLKTPNVLTVHDLIALDYPQYCKNENALYFRLCLPRSIKRADRIIAVSYTVKEDILRRFKIDPEKIDVVYHGVDASFKKIVAGQILERVRNKYHIPQQYILFVGNLEPKKNLVRLIDAFLLLKKKNAIPHKLLIVGQDGWKSEAIHKRLERSGDTSDIVFTGYVDNEDLPAIYSMAALFAFPSLYEGFGLPVLEAMACGTPVLISDRGALPEIAGNIFPQVDPTSVPDIAAGMLKCLTDEVLRARNIRYGLERVKTFTWENTAWQTLEVYNSLTQ